MPATVSRPKKKFPANKTSATHPCKEPKALRRRHIDPTTCEREYAPEELEFMRAVESYKRSSGRMFPTWSEILEVVHSLGYVRVESSSR
ncbi:MAG: hypothetical protein ABGW78_13025 [Pirellulales bacterium]